MSFFFYAAELVGTVAFAVSGAMLAVKKNMDIFGVLFLGIVTSLGGGVMRDVILGQTPPKMFYRVEYALLATCSALVVFLVIRLTHGHAVWSASALDSLLVLSDALGLGIFSVVGTQAGILAGYEDNAFLCIFLGMLTGVGGGALRDIMCTDIPFILRKHIYAVAAIAGSGIYYMLISLSCGDNLSSLAAIGVTVLIRLLARHYRWNLPKAIAEAKII